MKSVVALCALLLAAGASHAQSDSFQAFDKLKSLEGEWTGDGPNGLVVDVTYELVSGGNAVIETRRPTGEPSMISIFHLDNDSLMMTHYCSDGNQPQMRARMISERAMEFSKVNVTGLATPGEGHMHALEFDLLEADRIKQLWTWTEEGNEFPAAFELTRVE